MAVILQRPPDIEPFCVLSVGQLLTQAVQDGGAIVGPVLLPVDGVIKDTIGTMANQSNNRIDIPKAGLYEVGFNFRLATAGRESLGANLWALAILNDQSGDVICSWGDTFHDILPSGYGAASYRPSAVNFFQAVPGDYVTLSVLMYSNNQGGSWSVTQAPAGFNKFYAKWLAA